MIIEGLLSATVIALSILLVYLFLNRRYLESRKTVVSKLVAGGESDEIGPLFSKRDIRDRRLRHWLGRRRLRNEIELNLPNVLDLMRVCIDAGLDLNAAMDRVGQEFSETSPKVARLFRDLQLQLKAGANREQAFRTLGEETGNFEIRNLMISLAEAEQLGSSVSLILRTYSTELRTRRRIAAEERGAKLPTKLLFPLLVCLFPAMMIVLVGPSLIGALELLRGLR